MAETAEREAFAAIGRNLAIEKMVRDYRTRANHFSAFVQRSEKTVDDSEGLMRTLLSSTQDGRESMRPSGCMARFQIVCAAQGEMAMVDPFDECTFAPSLSAPSLSAPIPNDAPLHNDRYYGGSLWDAELRDFMNNSVGERLVGVFGPGFCEQLPNEVIAERRSGRNDFPDAPLIRPDCR